MKLYKKILIGIIGFIILLCVVSMILLNNLRKSAIPDYNKNVEIEGLKEDVTIYRDSYGIPHIYAKNEEDLYRSVGYVLAQDRLWQMDLLRRVTQGRLSEILGKDQVDTDMLMRALRIEEKSEKIFKKAPPQIVSALAAFSEGINSCINVTNLPPEFKILGYKPEPWEPVHSINLIGYMSWDLTSGWETELLLHEIKKEIGNDMLIELVPDLEMHKTEIFPDLDTLRIKVNETLLSSSSNLEKLGAEIFNGSNNWAISGKKSKTGKPLLANDMHLGLFAPGIWYQMHQHVENKLHVTGLVLPGQPFVIAGHNDSIAWGLTNVMVDDLDFYAETLNKDSSQYMLDGQWKDLIIKDERIKTREKEIITKTQKFTHRGPIVNQFKPNSKPALSIRWMGNEMSDEIRTVYLLNRAKNWQDFRNAVKSFKSVSQNIVYADVNGNIGLQTSAGIPIRPGNGIQIYPGNTSESDWTGTVPFEELPSEYNPDRGYVSSANNKTVTETYPYYISHWFAMPDRIDRIREMLEEKEKLGITDFQEIHSDFKSKKAEQFVPYFIEALSLEKSWNGIQQQALMKLQQWDCNMTANSQAASIFELLFRITAENLVKDNISPDLFDHLKGQKILLENLMVNVFSEYESSWIDNIQTSGKESLKDIIAISFEETIDELTNTLGENSDDWQWGKIHTFKLSHPLGVISIMDKILNLNKGPFEMPGSYHTVCPYTYSYNHLYKVNHGASQRHIYDVSDWNLSKTIIPTGTSGIPASDFYLDQTELYLSNNYHTDLFTKNKIEKEAIFTSKFLPDNENP